MREPGRGVGAGSAAGRAAPQPVPAPPRGSGVEGGGGSQEDFTAGSRQTLTRESCPLVWEWFGRASEKGEREASQGYISLSFPLCAFSFFFCHLIQPFQTGVKE